MQPNHIRTSWLFGLVFLLLIAAGCQSSDGPSSPGSASGSGVQPTAVPALTIDDVVITIPVAGVTQSSTDRFTETVEDDEQFL